MPEVEQPLISKVTAVTVTRNTAILELIKRQGSKMLLFRGVLSHWNLVSLFKPCQANVQKSPYWPKNVRDSTIEKVS